MNNLPDKELKEYHVRFVHDKIVFRWPPESLIKKVKRILGIKPKGSPFVKLEDKS